MNPVGVMAGPLAELYAAVGAQAQAGHLDGEVLVAALDGAGVVEVANPACERAGHWLWPEDAGSRWMADLFMPGSRPRWEGLLATAVAGRSDQALLHLRRIDDDQPCPYRVWILPQEGGAILLYAELMPAIDAQAAQEYARLVNEFSVVTRQVQKLLRESSSVAEARAEIIAHLAHEIRNPIGGFRGLAEEIRDDPNALPIHREYATVMARGSEDLLHLVNTVLDHARLDAGRLFLESVPVELSTLVHDCLALSEIRVKGRPVTLVENVAPDLPAILLGDPTRLRQVLTNLIVNATKFTEQGTITVSVRVESRDADRVHLRLEVSDTGPGIAPEAQDQLFAAYVQTDASIQRRHGGSGLGLSLCKRLAEAMGGSISLTSTLGVGSTFTVRLALLTCLVS